MTLGRSFYPIKPSLPTSSTFWESRCVISKTHWLNTVALSLYSQKNVPGEQEKHDPSPLNGVARVIATAWACIYRASLTGSRVFPLFPHSKGHIGYAAPPHAAVMGIGLILKRALIALLKVCVLLLMAFVLSKPRKRASSVQSSSRRLIVV